MKLFLIRHALPNVVAGGNTKSFALSKVGEGQAQTLKNSLVWQEVGVVISSPFPRCVETVRPAVESYKIPLEIDEAVSDIKREWVDNLDAAIMWIFEHPEESFEGKWESVEDARQRIIQAVEQKMQKYKGTHIAICSSAIILLLFKNSILGKKNESIEEWKSIGFAQVAIMNMETKELLQDFM